MLAGRCMFERVDLAAVTLDGEAKTAELLANIPEVLEAHHIAGEDCFLMKVRTRDAKSGASSSTVSSGEWLMPSLPQRTNSMAMPVTAATAIPS